MKTLFINACVRAGSRTLELAQTVLDLLGGEYEQLRLSDEHIAPLDRDTLEKRERFVREGDFSDPMFAYARQFAEADRIVIAAPFWDLLFPSTLRIYLEAVTVTGLAFRYTPQGIPEGLCRAKQLVYVTTAGGPIGEYGFGFNYVKALAQGFYGIRDVRCVSAEGLDVVGADADGIMAEAKARAAECIADLT